MKTFSEAKSNEGGVGCRADCALAAWNLSLLLISLCTSFKCLAAHFYLQFRKILREDFLRFDRKAVIKKRFIFFQSENHVSLDKVSG